MKRSYLLLHLAVLSLGFSAVFGKLITLNEGLLVWYRLSFSAAILFFVMKFYKINRPVSFNEKFGIGKIGMLVALSWVFFYASIKYANISVAVVCACLTSFFTAVFEPLLNKKKFRAMEFLLSAITVIGISLIFRFDTSFRLGIILGIISPMFLSLYSIYNERLTRQYDSKLINYYQMIGGTIGLGLLMPVYLHYFPQESIIPDGRNTFYLILLAIICTVFVYVALTNVLKNISAFTVNLTINLEPIYSIILAFILFNENKEVSIWFWIGLSLTVLSVALQTLISVRKVVN